MTPIRRGSALLVVLAALFLIELAVLTLWLIAAEANAASAETAAITRARIAAESAVRAALARWDEATLAWPAAGARFAVPGADGDLAGARFATHAERVHGGAYLIRSDAVIAVGGRVTARSAAIAHAGPIPHEELWRDFHSAVVSGGDVSVPGGATIDGSAPASLPPSWSTAHCARLAPAPPLTTAVPGLAHSAGAAASIAAATLLGAPPVLAGAPRSAPPDFARLGPIPLQDIARIADASVSGAIALAPTSRGAACDTTTATNWGAPGDPTHPCASHFPLVYAPGDLTVHDGQGQGILVVAGNLTLGPRARFFGAVLVNGRIDSEADIHGAVRVAGTSPSRLAGATFFNACALRRAFSLSPAFRRLYRHSDRWWLPAF